MKRIMMLCGFLVLAGATAPATSPVAAAELAVTEAAVQPAPPDQTAGLDYWGIRDAIYADVSLIDHLEANPDIDDAIKAPQIIAARADIHRLRRLLGPLVQTSPEPCCYSRPPLYVR